MDLKEAREIVGDYRKLPADKYKEAVELCIEDDNKPEVPVEEPVEKPVENQAG